MTAHSLQHLVPDIVLMAEIADEEHDCKRQTLMLPSGHSLSYELKARVVLLLFYAFECQRAHLLASWKAMDFKNNYAGDLRPRLPLTLHWGASGQTISLRSKRAGVSRNPARVV